MARTTSETAPPALATLHAAIMASLSSGVIALDTKGNVLTANPAARLLLGLDTASLQPGDALSPELREALEGILGEAMIAQAPVLRRQVRIGAGVSERWLGVSASPLAEDGHQLGVILLFADLTELRRLESAAQLNRQMALLGELTAGVVHELRNPLSVISGMAELLARRMESDPGSRDLVRSILREACELERSIAHFLGFARPFDFTPERHPPSVVRDRAIRLCERRAEHKNVVIESPAAPLETPSLIRVDSVRLAQALANLLGNAIDMTPRNGKVTLWMHGGHQTFVFGVDDGGPGIDEDNRDALFRPFFTNKEGGTGLGLSITHQIVTAHGGLVTCRNLPGGGARFQIELPGSAVRMDGADDAG